MIASIQAETIVTVSDFRNLMGFCKSHRNLDFLIGRLIVERPLTPAQFRRVPLAFRRKVRNPDDSVAFLEGLWSLEDSREC